MSLPRDVTALVRALALHRLRIAPTVRRQQSRWVESAAAIPDPRRRQAALAGLRDKGRNAEATGVFALLAPRPRRARALAAITALQTAVDYLDALDEQSDSDLERGLALHGALLAAVSGAPAESERRGEDDDPYLRGLLGACAAHLAVLPAVEAVRPALVEAVRRCGEGQARTHAAASSGAGQVGALREWAEGLAEGGGFLSGYLWWELAAGASSSVAAHALIAAAADPRTDAAEAAEVEAAYFPPIGALTVLLDDLVDRDADAGAGEHNYLAHCPDPACAAARLGLLADRATSAIAPLRRHPTHAAILAGVAAFYLADPGARTLDSVPVRDRLLASLGTPARVLELFLSRER
jgi:tetraprenyl-beta-curcumene synthase